ncbi:MAG: T9SS type A sorting domain-containing protein [Balneolales bacterium]
MATSLFAQDFWEGSSGPTGPNIYDFLEVDEDDFLIATRNGLFRGTLEGDISQDTSNALTREHYTVLFKDSNGVIWVGANGNNGGSGQHLFKSEDEGETWSEVSLKSYMAITDIIEDTDGTLYVSSIYNSGIHKKASGSDEWEDLTPNMDNQNVLDLLITSEGLLLAGTQNGGYYSEDGGETWQKSAIDIPDFQYVGSFLQHGENIYAATSSGVFVSTDGETFEITGFTNNSTFLTVINDEIYTGDTRRFDKTNDGFANTTRVGSGIRAEKLKYHNSTIYALTDALSRYDDDAEDWVKIWFGISGLKDFVLLQDGGIVATTANDILHSTAWGEPWTIISNEDVVPALAENVIAATNSGKLFVINAEDRPHTLNATSDYENWEQIEIPHDYPGRPVAVQVQTDDDGNLYLLTNNDILMSSDDGASWEPIIVFEEDYATHGFFIVNGEIFVSRVPDFQGNEAIILYSPDKGNTFEEWSSGEESNFTSFDGVVKLGDNQYFFVSNGAGVFETTDNGSTFEQRNQGMLLTSTSKILAIQDTLYVPYSKGVYVSVDSAKTWSNWKGGLNTTDTTFPDIEFSSIDGRIYLMSSVHGLYRSVSEFEVHTSTQEYLTLPKNIELGQNYPNPFNPKTVIPFELNSSGFTTLNVFNMLGQHIGTLVSEPLQAGSHTITFDASHLPSGVYIYQLTHNNESTVRKLTLVK